MVASAVKTSPAMSTASTEMTATTAAEATTAATTATVTSSSAGWQDSPNSLEATEKEYGRWEHRAVQSVQRRDFLILRFGGVVGRVTLLSRHHQVAVVLGLMAFINA